MYNLEENTLTLDGKTEQITGFAVGFAVPGLGLFDDPGEAVKACREVDFDPKLMIKPVPIVLSENNYEIFL